MEEITKNHFNLSISRCISTVTAEEEISLQATNETLVEVEKDIEKALNTHHEFLKHLGLPLLPGVPSAERADSTLPLRARRE